MTFFASFAASRGHSQETSREQSREHSQEHVQAFFFDAFPVLSSYLCIMYHVLSIYRIRHQGIFWLPDILHVFKYGTRHFILRTGYLGKYFVADVLDNIWMSVFRGVHRFFGEATRALGIDITTAVSASPSNVVFRVDHTIMYMYHVCILSWVFSPEPCDGIHTCAVCSLVCACVCLCVPALLNSY